jgi:hypothetical protein
MFIKLHFRSVVVFSEGFCLQTSLILKPCSLTQVGHEQHNTTQHNTTQHNTTQHNTREVGRFVVGC